MPSIRNLFLVEGFARLRADEVLSPRGKVPKGRRGRPKGACGMAAPGPPVAKKQCTASLAGARPAGFTSVPGRATVAFKVGFHFVKAKSLRDPRIRLWRKRGLAQLIPPRLLGAGLSLECRQGAATAGLPCSDTCLGIGAMQGAYLLRHPIGCWPRAKPNGVPDTDPVGRETRGSALIGARGVRGYPSAV